jgi:hypothetical protein
VIKGRSFIEFLVAAFVGSLLIAGAASAQVTCAQEYFKSPDRASLGFAPPDVEQLVGQIADEIGLSLVGFQIVPCTGVGKVRSYNFTGKFAEDNHIPQGDYIFYDPTWVKEVVGPSLQTGGDNKQRDEAIVLFGHELGHHLGRHFTAAAGLPAIEKERAADRFAGRAACGMGVKWERVKDLLTRLRTDADTPDYPSREQALKAAQEGFSKCQKITTDASQQELLLLGGVQFKLIKYDRIVPINTTIINSRGGSDREIVSEDGHNYEIQICNPGDGEAWISIGGGKNRDNPNNGGHMVPPKSCFTYEAVREMTALGSRPDEKIGGFVGTAYLRSY